MKQVRVKIVGSGAQGDPFTVDLPTWLMVGEIDHNVKECQVYIPDDETTDGEIDQNKIRKKYGGKWKEFDKKWVSQPEE